MWSLVPLPTDVDTIGEIAIHEVNLDRVVSGLTEAQQAEMAEQAFLEQAIKPLCDQVVIKVGSPGTTPCHCAARFWHGISQSCRQAR